MTDMTDFIRVNKTLSDLPPGEMTWVAVDGARVLLANVNGALYALEDFCGHQRVALSRGRLQGHQVECPLHFACFDVRTGELINGPMSEDVPTYDVHVEDDAIYIKRAPNDF